MQVALEAAQQQVVLSMAQCSEAQQRVEALEAALHEERSKHGSKQRSRAALLHSAQALAQQDGLLPRDQGASQRVLDQQATDASSPLHPEDAAVMHMICAQQREIASVREGLAQAHASRAQDGKAAAVQAERLAVSQRQVRTRMCVQTKCVFLCVLLHSGFAGLNAWRLSVCAANRSAWCFSLQIRELQTTVAILQQQLDASQQQLQQQQQQRADAQAAQVVAVEQSVELPTAAAGPSAEVLLDGLGSLHVIWKDVSRQQGAVLRAALADVERLQQQLDAAQEQVKQRCLKQAGRQPTCMRGSCDTRRMC
jgi:hypothetical protein